MEPSVTARLNLHVPSLFQKVHQNPQLSPRKHKHYYFADGNIIFLVENTLYNLHRYFFQQYSSSFASILSHSPGRWDDKPIPLTDVTVKDFDLFLSIPYPANYGVFSAASVDEWSSILDLAAKWKFQSIKALALKQLLPITSPIDKLVLGRRHDIMEWLPDAYSAICGRKDALTLEEGLRLGLEDVIKISALRQGGSGPDFLPTVYATPMETTFGPPSVPVNSYPGNATQPVATTQPKQADTFEIKSKSQRLEEIFEGGDEYEWLRDEEDNHCGRKMCKICGQEGTGDHLCTFCGLHNCVCPTTKQEDKYCKLCGEEGLCRICPFCSRYDCVCACTAANRCGKRRGMIRSAFPFH